MATTTTRARHRAASKPVTPLDSLKEIDGRKGLIAAATTSLALGTIWAGTAMASPESADNTTKAAPVATQVGNAVSQAHLAVAANPEVTAPEGVAWTASEVELPAAAPQQNNTRDNNANRSYASESVSIPANIAGGSIADIALRYQGVPYVYGGATPRGFDCSGFVGYVYAQVGIGLPRTSYAQGAAGHMISAAAARPGDIVYYGHHVGIYLGEGKMVHAPHPGDRVKVQAIYGSPQYVRIG